MTLIAAEQWTCRKARAPSSTATTPGNPRCLDSLADIPPIPCRSAVVSPDKPVFVGAKAVCDDLILTMWLCGRGYFHSPQ